MSSFCKRELFISNDIAAKFRNIDSFKRTRFAPSPTGYLHLGHVLSACYVWLLARLKGAEIVLRIEDHDLSRCREEYVQAIYEDLLQLGFVADLGEHSSSVVYRQSDHRDRYTNFLSDLKTYFCSCTRKEIMNRAALYENKILAGDGERTLNSTERFNHSQTMDLFYDGYCRNRNLKEGALRLYCDKLPREFLDLYLANHVLSAKRPANDPLLQERNGNFSYHFCVVVDDYIEGIDFVIRGQDLIHSTGNQIILHELIGNNNPPRFFHHPLVVDDQGRKFSKRFFSESVRSMMQNGMGSDEILGLACGIGGLWPAGKKVTLPQLIEHYQKLQ